MIGAALIVHALESGTGSLRLIAGEALAPGIVFSRASTAMALGADGVTWQQAASNAPRLTGAARRLLIEAARTNGARNPRGEGTVPGSLGSGGSLPTGWALPAFPGLTWEVVGTGMDGGFPYVRLRLFGTSTAASTIRPNLDAIGNIAAAPGQTWTCSHLVRLAPGAPAVGTLTWQSEVREYANTTAGSLTTGSAVSLSTTWRRAEASRLVTGSTTTSVLPTLRLAVASGAALNLTIDLAGVQAEQAASASSPILPPAGAIAASTRAVDAPILPLSAAQRVQGTLVGTILLPQLPPANLSAGIFQLDDGTNANRLTLRVLPTGALRLVGSGAATALDLVVGSVAAGAIARFAVSYGADGVSACLNGGTIASAAGTVVPPDLTALVIGHGSRAYDLALNGEIGPLTLHLSRLPDATLQALTSL
ncbi:hypothetical protein [Roseomonas sp. WA12]